MCELNADKLKSSNCSKCAHIWSNAIKCDCANKDQDFDGQKCIESNSNEIFNTDKNGYLLFEEKILEHKCESNNLIC